VGVGRDQGAKVNPSGEVVWERKKRKTIILNRKPKGRKKERRFSGPRQPSKIPRTLHDILAIRKRKDQRMKMQGPQTIRR